MEESNAIDLTKKMTDLNWPRVHSSSVTDMQTLVGNVGNINTNLLQTYYTDQVAIRRHLQQILFQTMISQQQSENPTNEIKPNSRKRSLENHIEAPLALPPAKREKALDLTCKNPTDEVESTTSDSGNQSGLEEGNSQCESHIVFT